MPFNQARPRRTGYTIANIDQAPVNGAAGSAKAKGRLPEQSGLEISVRLGYLRPRIGLGASRGKVRRDLREGRGNLEPEQAGGRDDANRDQGGNQAILNGRGAGLVPHETCNEVLHDNSPKFILASATCA